MSEDTDAKPAARPQRTTRSERRKSRRPGEPGASGAPGHDPDDEAATYDTLVDVELSSDDEAATDQFVAQSASEAEPPDEAQATAAPAPATVAASDSFESLDDDESRPTREMTVVPLDLSEEDKTNPRIRVDELAARLQAERPQPARGERGDAPPIPPPVVARAKDTPDATDSGGDEPTHPRIVVKTSSVVIAPSRVIGVGTASARDDDDVAPRMASRPPPPSTPVASPSVISVTIPRPPSREALAARDESVVPAVPVAAAARAERAIDEAELAVEDAGAVVVEGETEDSIVDVDVAEIESSGESRTPPPPPAPEGKRAVSSPPKRPPPPPVAPGAPPLAPPAVPPAAPPAVPAAVAATAPAAPPAPPAPPAVTAVAASSAPSQPATLPKPDDEQKKRKQARQWWERFFSEDYLRAVQPPTPAQIAHQIDFVVESLGLERGATILDVGCGLGLQCVELTRRGYLTVGLDLSLAMITRAAEAAQRQGLKINFLHADIREMQFDGAFDAALCMGTTFGFFDDESNRDVLARLHHALRPGGRLLLDVANRDYVMPMQPNLVWFEGEGCVCMEESDFNHFTSRLTVKRTMMREDGTQASSEYSLRLYSLHELGQLIQQMGFRVIEVSGQEAVRGAFFGNCAPRIMILAERRTPGRMSQVMPPERPSSELLRPLPTERGSAEIPKPPKPPGATGA